MAAICIQANFAEFLDMQGSFPYSERLEPKCLEAQRFNLRPTIGHDFYAEIMEVVDNGFTITGSTTFTQQAFDDLLPYMRNYVKYSAYVKYLRDASVILTRTGPVIKKNPHSEALTGSDKTDSIRYYSSLAKGYSGELKDYLDDNSSKFQLYGNDGTADNTSSPGITITSL